MKSKFFGAVAWIIGILGVIGSIVMGFSDNFITLLAKELSNDAAAVSFNFKLFLTGLISTALLCMIFAGFSCVLSEIEDIKGSGDTTGNESTALDGEFSNSDDSDDKWECPNCHAMNNYNGQDPSNVECSHCHWHL